MLVQIQVSGTDSKAAKGAYAAFHTFTNGRTTLSCSGLLFWSSLGATPTPVPAVIAPAAILFPFLQQSARQDPQQLTTTSLLPGTSLNILLQQPTASSSSLNASSLPLLPLPARFLTSFTAPSLPSTAAHLLRRLNSSAATPQWRYSWGLATNSPGDSASPEVWATWVLLQPCIPEPLQQQLVAAGLPTLPPFWSLPSHPGQHSQDNVDQQQQQQQPQQRIAGHAPKASVGGHPPNPLAVGSPAAGAPLLVHGCPFGCLAPQHFFNSTVAGRVMNSLTRSTSTQQQQQQQQQQQCEQEHIQSPASRSPPTSSSCRDSTTLAVQRASKVSKGMCPACSSSSSSGPDANADAGVLMLDVTVFPGMEGGPVTCGCCGSLLAVLVTALTHRPTRVEVPLAVPAAPLLVAAASALQQLPPGVWVEDPQKHSPPSPATSTPAAAAGRVAGEGGGRSGGGGGVPQDPAAVGVDNSSPFQQQQQQPPRQQQEVSQAGRRPLPPWLQQMLNKQPTSSRSSRSGRLPPAAAAAAAAAMGCARGKDTAAPSSTAAAADGWQYMQSSLQTAPAAAAALVVTDYDNKSSPWVRMGPALPAAAAEHYTALAAAAAGVVIIKTADSWASGVIASPGGIIVTNAHLFDPPQRGTSHPGAIRGDTGAGWQPAGTMEKSSYSSCGRGPLQQQLQGAGAAAAAAAGAASIDEQPQVQVWVRLSAQGAAAAHLDGPRHCNNLHNSSSSSSSSSSSRAGSGRGGSSSSSSSSGGGGGGTALQSSLFDWLPARLLYRFRGHLDVAVLQVHLPAARTGEPLTGQSRSLRLPAMHLAAQGLTQGAAVAVVGHGLFGPRAGFEPSVTWGSCVRVISQPPGRAACRGPGKQLTPLQQQQQLQQQQPAMLITTAAVHSGASGGAVVCPVTGDLLGLVTSNARHVGGATLPRLNFSIPAADLAPLWLWAQQHDGWRPQQQQHTHQRGGPRGKEQQALHHTSSKAAAEPGSVQALRALDVQGDEVAAAIWALRPFAAVASAAAAECSAAAAAGTADTQQMSSGSRNRQVSGPRSGAMARL